MTTMELIERGIGHNCLSDAYELGRLDYEAECEKLFENNPPMHFNREQIMWIKEYVKQARLDARADAIEEFKKTLLANDVIDKSVVRRVSEQLKEQNK